MIQFKYQIQHFNQAHMPPRYVSVNTIINTFFSEGLGKRNQ